MRRFPTSLFVLAAASAAFFAVAPVWAQTESDTLEVGGEESKGSLSIKIDAKGIRVEGSLGEDHGADTSEADRRIIFDTPRRYREMGTDIVKFGEDVYVARDELVRGDIVVFGGDVTVEGKVVGNLVVMAGDAEVRSGAEINGDVVVLGGVLDEDSEVLIHGERVMFKEISFPAKSLSHYLGAQTRFFDFLFIPVQFFVSIILSFLIILFMRERIDRTQEHVSRSFLKSFGAGFLTVFVGCFVVTFLAIILLITLIGIPLAFVLVVSCLAVFVIARTVFVYALGIKVNEKLKLSTTNPFAIVLVGTAVLYLPALLGYGISLWPLGGPVGVMFKFVGMLISTFAYLVGLGAIFLSRFGNRALPAEPEPDMAAGAAE